MQQVVAELRESEWTGHACELETSAYLAVDPTRVRMDRAVRDINPYMSKHFWADLVGRRPEGYANPAVLVEYWSTVSATGTWGDPTVATREKGERILQAASEELVELVRELKARPVRPRVPHQLAEVAARNSRVER